MKHELRITLWLVFLFLITQVVGLGVTNQYIDHETTKESGNVTFAALPFNVERPVVDESTSYTYVLAAILIGTILVLLLMRFKKVMLWKTWFLLSVWLVLTVSLAAIMPQNAALFLSLVFAVWKVFKPNVIVHNLTEIFIYGGLAAIFVPIMNVFSAFIMLLVISGYDMFAVWKSKHMIKMAQFQTKTKVFAGLLIPYRLRKKGKGKKVQVKNAMLGGGDIGFTLIFAGVVMKDLMLMNTVGIGFIKALIIPIVVSIALFLLFVKGKKDKFYPAMPFLTSGALIGYGLLYLIGF